MPRPALWFWVLCVLCGCSSPWDDLADRYSVVEAPSVAAQNRTITLVGSNHEGAFSMRDIGSFSIDDAGIYMALNKPSGYFDPPVRIPVSAVTACSRISWSPGFDTPLWIGDAKVEIVLNGHERETLAWCHERQIPVVPREVELEWIRSPGDDD